MKTKGCSKGRLTRSVHGLRGVFGDVGMIFCLKLESPVV
jgi:hypothetical protein